MLMKKTIKTLFVLSTLLSVQSTYAACVANAFRADIGAYMDGLCLNNAKSQTTCETNTFIRVGQTERFNLCIFSPASGTRKARCLVDEEQLGSVENAISRNCGQAPTAALCAKVDWGTSATKRPACKWR